METLRLGDPEALRKAVPLASGFLLLDPTLPKRMKYDRRWGLLINAEISRSKNVILGRDRGIKTHAMNKRLEEAHRWLRQAQEDIAAARDVHEDRRYNWSCFMAKQAAEKALKAVYVGRGEPVEWIHSCLILIQGDPEKRLAGILEMKDLTAAASDLDKAYIPSRYPNGVPHGIPSDFFTQEDSQRCLTHAEAIVTRCNQFLPTT